MVKVVVSLTQSSEGGDNVVSRAVTIVEWLVAEPMSQTVNTEGRLLNNEDAQDTSVNEAANPVVPAQTSDHGGEDETHGDNAREEVQVLPDNDGVLVEVGDVGSADALGILLHDHPSDVAVQQTLPDGVGVLLCVGVAVVGTVTIILGQ